MTEDMPEDMNRDVQDEIPDDISELAQREIGGIYVYGHPTGLGYGDHHKQQAGFGEQTAEMMELDLGEGTEVEYIANDEDSGWPIVQWKDGNGINRITTIDPDSFDTLFIPR